MVPKSVIRQAWWLHFLQPGLPSRPLGGTMGSHESSRKHTLGSGVSLLPMRTSGPNSKSFSRTLEQHLSWVMTWPWLGMRLDLGSQDPLSHEVCDHLSSRSRPTGQGMARPGHETVFKRVPEVASMTTSEPPPPPMSHHGGPQILQNIKNWSQMTPRWIPDRPT